MLHRFSHHIRNDTAHGCIGDSNQDDVINGADLGSLLGTWGNCP